MKALIAVTCIAVLAAVGYFFWGEFGMAERVNPPDPTIETAMKRILVQAGTADGNRDTARQFCITRFAANPYRHNGTPLETDCRAAGFIK